MSAPNNLATKDAVNSENSLQTITKTLQKLLKDSSKKHAGLRKGCQDAIGMNFIIIKKNVFYNQTKP